MKSDERVEQVQGDIYCFPVAKMPVSGDELIERLPVDELGDEIPVAGAGLACPEDLHHVGMTDLPQGADLAATPPAPGGAVEELERPFLSLDVVAPPVDLREAAPPEQAQDLEAALEDVADRVVGSPGRARGSHLCGVIAALSRCERAGAAHLCGSGGVRRHVPDSPARVAHATEQPRPAHHP